MIEKGINVKTRRPDITGLEPILRAANVLHGERNAPELPIPHSAIERYAQRFGLSSRFVALVAQYDQSLSSAMRRQTQEMVKVK